MSRLDPERIPWAPLLKQITHSHPQFLVWKNLDKALINPNSDIDSASPPEATDGITDTLCEYAFSKWQASTIIQCDHNPGIRLHYIFADALYPFVGQFDIWTQPSRVLAPWAAPRSLLQYTYVDGTHGIRRLNQVAEETLRLLFKLDFSGFPALSIPDVLELSDTLRSDWSLLQQLCRDISPNKRAGEAFLFFCSELAEDASWDDRLVRRVMWASLRAASSYPEFALAKGAYRARQKLGLACYISGLSHRGRKLSSESEWADLINRSSAGHVVRRQP